MSDAIFLFLEFLAFGLALVGICWLAEIFKSSK